MAASMTQELPAHEPFSRRILLVALVMAVTAGGVVIAAGGGAASTGPESLAATFDGPSAPGATEGRRDWVEGSSASSATGPSTAVAATNAASGVVPLTTVPPTAPPSTATTPPTAPPQASDDPSVVARPIPNEPPPSPPAPAPAWAASTHRTAAGLVSTDVGCAAGLDAAALDRFFGQRLGPVLGWDYQHVIALGGDRYLWLFQDAFVDHSGTASTLDRSRFVHNAALLQEGRCFRLLHGGSATAPAPFEPGTGTRERSTWFWPMGGEVHGGVVHVVWVQMVKDAYDPQPPDGLGWHPAATWIARYDAQTLARLDFAPAPDAGVAPIYGYAMASDATHTYLFGNTFEQNLAREGGYWVGPHSATAIYLARVPRGQLHAQPEYRTAGGWTPDASRAEPILRRHWAEFPLQPRWIDGQWVAVAAVDGYWSEQFSVDVAIDPWGPWTTVESRRVGPRGDDPAMNTYHAHLMPWRGAHGELVVTMSNNARDMLRDAWPHPHRYRPTAFSSPWAVAVPPPPTTAVAPVTTSKIPPTSTTTTTTTSTTSTTVAVSTTTTTSTVPASSTTVTTTTTTTTAVPPSSTTVSSTTSVAGDDPPG